jgi:hypothetical protein
MTDGLKIGDPIEVCFITHDGTIWNPATVVYVADDHIGVAYAGGRRQAVRKDQWRVPNTTRPVDVQHQPAPGKVTRGGA